MKKTLAVLLDSLANRVERLERAVVKQRSAADDAREDEMAMEKVETEKNQGLGRPEVGARVLKQTDADTRDEDKGIVDLIGNE